MLIWCLKQVKHFRLKFLINGSFFGGRQSYQIYYNTIFLLQVNVLMRLSLIEKIFKDANMMCISFIVKHP